MKIKNQITKNQPVTFEVVNMFRANKPGYVVAEVRFHGNSKSYTFVRMDKGGFTIIDGCKVEFKPMYLPNEVKYQVTNISRMYDTEGTKRLDTTGLSKPNGIANKIKQEIEAIEDKPETVTAVEEKPEEDWNKPVMHERYNDIKMCLTAGIPVYLAGPAGSGKNHTVEQIAKELGWNFYFSNSVQQEFKLTGFIDAGGNYHETEFYKALTNDGDCVFFLDEMDASIPEVLVLLNAAIANGYFEFPTGRINFNHVHFVAAGNTVGSGADEMYTGRMVIDQATLDRFAIIEFDYSEQIEMHIAKGNKELVTFVHELRKQAKERGIRATFSYRCITMMVKLESQGMPLKVAVKISVLKGMDKDTVNTFNVNGSMGYNKYGQALKAVQMAA